ncbi:hypothetical protein ACFX2B_040863 [Malus domestica]
MDKSWATLNSVTKDYRIGLAKFISNSSEVSSHDGNMKCPCAKCLNRFWLSNNEVKVHLIVEGMDRSYLEVVWAPCLKVFSQVPVPINNHTGQEALIPAYARKFQAMVESAVQANLQLFKHILPNIHSLSKKFMNTKALLKNFMLPHQRIHACENDCMLYRKHDSGLDVCHTCGVSRYTTEVDDTTPSSKKRIPQKSNVPSYASPRDWNPVTGLVDYYRVLTDVFEIKYHMERKVVGRMIGGAVEHGECHWHQ